MFRNGCRSAVTSANNSLAAALSAAGRERRSAAPPVSVCGLPLAVVKVPTRASNRKRKPLFRTGSLCCSVQFSSIIRSLPAPISPPALRPAPRRSRSNTSAKLRTPPGPGALPGARWGPATSYFLLQLYNSELSQVRSVLSQRAVYVRERPVASQRHRPFRIHSVLPDTPTHPS